MTSTVDNELIRARQKLDELEMIVQRLRVSLDAVAARPTNGMTKPDVAGTTELLTDRPYDPALFADADDEGVSGMRGNHKP
jgi:hypothetical protein